MDTRSGEPDCQLERTTFLFSQPTAVYCRMTRESFLTVPPSPTFSCSVRNVFGADPDAGMVMPGWPFGASTTVGNPETDGRTAPFAFARYAFRMSTTITPELVALLPPASLGEMTTATR